MAQEVKQMVYGIVVAAGQGSRIGFRKQYAELAGKPVWRRSVEALLAGGVAKVWLTVPEDDVPDLKREVERGDLYQRVRVTAGGGTRFESVRLGLSALLRDCEAGECELPLYVAVHDAARPFVSEADVRAVVQAAGETGGAILASPCPDTVKRACDQYIAETIPREQIWLAQTPQVFRTEWMRERYFDPDVFFSATDDAAVFEAVGYKVRIVPATSDNRKITTPEDWEYAKWLAKRRWGGGNG
jgi:2-C-methyl-D-erythritol 4-phosphate cytidylyltransferase